MPDALTLLDREWDTYRTSAAASRALARWDSAGTTPTVGSMDALVAAMQDRGDPDGRDRLVYRMAVIAAGDRDACRVLLAVVRPGLTRIARTYRRWWGWEDTASMTVTAAFERIVTYPAHRTRRPAANIVRDVQNRLHRARAKEAALEQSLGGLSGLDTDEPAASTDATSPVAEVVELVDLAVSTGRLSTDEANLIIGRRVFDVPTDDVAAATGYQPGTVRAHRRAAEERLTLIARSVLGIHGAVA